MFNKLPLLAVCLLAALQAWAQPSCDVLIRNGRIINGTGNNWFYGDIAVANGRILAIGKNLSYNSSTIINAGGLIVAPGFIDVHTHIEGDEDKDPLAQSFIYDGVTTVVAGNCGASNLNIGRYFSWLDSLKLSINVASLIGHNDVRKAVLGRANRAPSAVELKKMEQFTLQAMKDGAAGLSTGLIYIPGTYAQPDEIIALARIAAQYNGVYATHMRSEGNNVADAIREALQIGRAAKIPVEISHFKLSGQQNWGRSKETVAMIETARREGIDVTIDQYPYTASSTSISTLLPSDVLADGQDSIRARLQRPDIRKYVVEDMLKSLKQRKLKHFSYAVVAYYKPDTSYNGKSIEQINLMKGRKHKAREEALTVIDLMMNGGAGAVFHGMSEGDVQYIMKYPFDMFASDASIRIMNEGMPHPRGYGTNARVLARYVREEKVLSLEEAIRRMTSLPAQKFHLADRGLLKEGMAADIVIFDPEKVQDLATFEKPHAYSTGFAYVLVNGKVTVDRGRHTGERNGKTLRNGL
ncbi:N-acyl-D-amino-acid deacylase family protein [Niabella drilacis]|uniref:N-acyl-D-amino-acid deacylase n=2 Tax=Niabella drilacis (strain DSM 25811 / CCM 8410 / CCUG 62505 / LMG 26954 / E90) TaxID=1285928 RepID=A0A1G6YJ50_NIADE|nr:D-aminoacylase [Niabella drilacis]SDD90370.1 N-acyl-D-amino-acid deacylase [Niabella drilacis]